MSSSQHSKGEIVTLIATAVVVLVSVTTFIATTFLNKSNKKLSYQSKAMMKEEEGGASMPAPDTSSPSDTPVPPPANNPTGASRSKDQQCYDDCYGDQNCYNTCMGISVPTSAPTLSCDCVNGTYQGSGCVGGQINEPCSSNANLSCFDQCLSQGGGVEACNKECNKLEDQGLLNTPTPGVGGNVCGKIGESPNDLYGCCPGLINDPDAGYCRPSVAVGKSTPTPAPWWTLSNITPTIYQGVTPKPTQTGISGSAIQFCGTNFTPGELDYEDCLKGYNDKSIYKSSYQPTPTVIPKISIGKGCSNFGGCCGSGAVCQTNDEWGINPPTCQACPNEQICIEGKGCTDEAITKHVESGECKIEGSCCGNSGVCGSTGLFGLGGMKCTSCTGSTICQPGQGCININQALAQSENKNGCQQPGASQVSQGKCFICFTASDSQKSGEWVAVSDKLCKEERAGEKITSSQVLNNTLSTEEQHRIRDVAYDEFINDPNVDLGDKIAAKTMQIGDGVTRLWGGAGKNINKTIAAIGDTFGQEWGDRNAEAQSSLANYYLATTKAAAEAEKQGKKYEVNTGQALATGLSGGLKFADGLLLGIPNIITGGGVDKVNDTVLELAYGEDNKAAIEAAKTSQIAGNDIANTVALIIPVAKGTQALSTGASQRLTAAAEALEESGQSGMRSSLFRTGAKVYSGVGKTGEILESFSPESWAADFIKSKPITTQVEVAAKTISDTTVAQTVGSTVARGIEIAEKVPGVKTVGKVVNATAKAGSAVVDSFLPKSALTYTPDEAARFLARDIKLGLADETNAATRLVSTYHPKIDSVTDVKIFADKLENTQDIPSQVITNLKNDLEHTIIRDHTIPERLKIIKSQDIKDAPAVQKAVEEAAGGFPLDEELLTEYRGKFNDIKDPAKRAEAILADMEKKTTRETGKLTVYVADPDKIAQAKLYAKEIGGNESEQSMFDQVRKKIFGEQKTEIALIGDQHSDLQVYEAQKARHGLVDGNGKVIPGKKAIFQGDYVGKASTELITAEHPAPGLEMIQDIARLQRESGGDIIGLQGNWEPRLALGMRYAQILEQDPTNQTVREALDLLQGKTLAKTEVMTAIQPEKFGQVVQDISELKFMNVLPDGSIAQHPDTAELLRYAFRDKDEVVRLLGQKKVDASVIEDVITAVEKRGTPNVINEGNLRSFKIAFDALDWNNKKIASQVNKNAQAIMKEGMTAIDSDTAEVTLKALVTDSNKDLVFYQQPEAAVAFKDIFDPRAKISHGHSPLDEIRKAVLKTPGNSINEIDPGVFLSADTQLLSTDVRLSRGMRVLGKEGKFFDVVDGVMQVVGNVERMQVLQGPSQITVRSPNALGQLYESLLWSMNGVKGFSPTFIRGGKMSNN